MITTKFLCDAFRDRAAAIHSIVDYSYSCGLGISEEALTDVTLVELRRRLAGHVLTRKFTKHEEATLSGADWLWTIGRPGRWFSLLVQAKLARPGSKRLPNLHHGKGSQRRTLVAYARRERCQPAYVIYSAFSGVASRPVASSAKTRGNRSPAWQPACPLADADARQMGAVLVRTRHVALMDRSKTNRDDVVRLLNGGVPWACLFCCQHDRGELADTVAAAIDRMPIDTPDPRSPGGAKSPEPDDVFESVETLVTDRPPTIVGEMLAGIAPSVPPPVANVVILSSEPLDPRLSAPSTS